MKRGGTRAARPASWTQLRLTRVHWAIPLLSLCVLLTSCVTAPTPRATGEIAVLVSQDSPAFTRVANIIRRRHGGGVRVYSLAGGGRELVRKAIARSSSPFVVAVGLPAANMARGLRGKRVIFCQVFNYESHDLVTPWMKGVSAIPSVHKQFRAWKALDPSLTHIGVITGADMHGLLRQARAAAKSNGLVLVHRQVASDKDLLYTYKRLSPEIQGLWLLPDNRILSMQAIRDLLTYSAKHGKQVLVFNPKLMRLGGLMSAESQEAEIAAKALRRLEQAAASSNNVPGSAVWPLNRATIMVNPVMMKRLGLGLPTDFKGEIYAP